MITIANIIVFTIFWYSEFSSFVHSTTLTTGRCDVNIGNRNPCGWSTIPPSQCKARKCCWDSTAKDGIRCFKSTKSSAAEEPVGSVGFTSGMPVYKSINTQETTKKTCDVLTSDRIACQISSSSKSECEQNGCCFDPFSGASSACYQTGLFKVDQQVNRRLQCIRQCSGLSWRAVRARYVRCMSDHACWMLFGGNRTGRCLAKCKKTIEISSTRNNIKENTNSTQIRTTVATLVMPFRYEELPQNVIKRIFHFPHNLHQEIEE